MQAASHLLMMRLTQGSPRAAANAASSASPIIQSNISSDGIFSSVVREGAAPELDAIIVLGKIIPGFQYEGFKWHLSESTLHVTSLH